MRHHEQRTKNRYGWLCKRVHMLKQSYTKGQSDASHAAYDDDQLELILRTLKYLDIPVEVTKVESGPNTYHQFTFKE